MSDIFQQVAEGVATFTAESEHAREWMQFRLHETQRTYAMTQPTERDEAVRFKMDAEAAGLTVYHL